MSRRHPEDGPTDGDGRTDPLEGLDSLGVPSSPVSVVAEPLENGVAVFAPMAPATGGTDDQPTSQLNLDLYLTNTGQAPVQLSDFAQSYLPPPLVLTAGMSVDQLVANDLLSDPNILPGGTRKLLVPASSLPYPAPRAIYVELSFEGYAAPVDLTLPLVPHVSCSESGGYRFPFKLSDLAAGQYWSGGIPRLVEGAPSHHRSSASQRFAYDLLVRMWDPDLNPPRLRRTFPGSSGESNEDYLAWGKPIYAMAAGVVVRCGRDVPDNPRPPAKISGGGGNVVWIQHDDGMVILYAHLMHHSSPVHLCQPGYRVCDGEFLGLVGNSGTSTEAHLHVHAQRGEPNESTASGRPLLFRGIQTLPSQMFQPDDTDEPWAYLDGHGLSGSSLIWPAPFPPATA